MTAVWDVSVLLIDRSSTVVSAAPPGRRSDERDEP
jgi:hypothetical protein